MAVVAALSLTSGVAAASHIGAGSPTPPRIASYRGTDPAGAVTFKTYTYSGPPATKELVESFHFADRCSASGSTIKARLRVGPKHHFQYTAHGFTVHGSLTGAGDKAAHGTARLVTHTCHSGVLKFTATKT